MPTKSIVIPAEVCDKIQRADIEQSARMEIIVSCIKRGVPTNEPAFMQYQNEYNEWYVKFVERKNQLEAEYVTPLNTDEHIAKNWSLDYTSRTLTISY